MEKFVRPYDMECMKMALLKHEETFKQQVYELHRLYEIQRMLMKKMQSMQNINESLKRQREFKKEDDEIELTLGLGLGPTRNLRKNKPTSATTSNSLALGMDSRSLSVEKQYGSLNQPPCLRQVLI